MERIHLYFHCKSCLKHHRYLPLEVGLTQAGDLVVVCPQHGEVLRFLNDEHLGQTLRDCVLRGCTCERHRKEGN